MKRFLAIAFLLIASTVYAGLTLTGGSGSTDSRIISNLENDEGSAIPDQPSDVGGWPTYTTTESAYSEPSNPLGVRADGFYNIGYDLYVKAQALE